MRLKGFIDPYIIFETVITIFQFQYIFLDIIDDTEWATLCIWIYISWVCQNKLQYILGPEVSSKNAFDSFRYLFIMFTQTPLCLSLSDICKFIYEKSAQVLQYTIGDMMWSIVRHGSKPKYLWYIFIKKFSKCFKGYCSIKLDIEWIQNCVR